MTIRFIGQKHPLISEYANFPVPLRQISPLSAERAALAFAALGDPGNKRKYGQSEPQYPSAVCYYYPPFLTDIFRELGDHISSLLDFELVETYYYARLYGTGDELKIHTDRGSCFVSVSLCFGYDYSPMFPKGSSWPIGVLAETSGGGEEPVEFRLQPGEGILYPGCSAPHWRDMFLGDHCGQAFFHWVPKDDRIFGSFYGDPDKLG
jgi:hypothetical protein